MTFSSAFQRRPCQFGFSKDLKHFCPDYWCHFTAANVQLSFTIQLILASINPKCVELSCKLGYIRPPKDLLWLHWNPSVFYANYWTIYRLRYHVVLASLRINILVIKEPSLCPHTHTRWNHLRVISACMQVCLPERYRDLAITIRLYKRVASTSFPHGWWHLCLMTIP